MTFKVRVGFTGVCSFVINTDTDRKVRACVVLPDAEGSGDQHHTDKRAPDGDRLLRHRAYLKFKLRQVAAITNKNDVPLDSEGLVYIEGFRVSFKIPESDLGSNAFTIHPSLRAHLLSMEEVAGVYADDYDEIVKPSPRENLIAAQILINNGTLKYDPQKDDPPLATWFVPSNLNYRFPPLSKALAHEVALELLNISDLVVSLKPLADGSPFEIKLKPVSSEPVELTIAHLCSENPLRWKAKDVEQKDDTDFKWHYMLLSEATRDNLTRGVLGGLPLPIPLPRFKGAAQGANCPPSIAKDRKFNLD